MCGERWEEARRGGRGGWGGASEDSQKVEGSVIEKVAQFSSSKKRFSDVNEMMWMLLIMKTRKKMYYHLPFFFHNIQVSNNISEVRKTGMCRLTENYKLLDTNHSIINNFWDF